MTHNPTIDYTSKDYESLRRAMLDLARYRLPEWTDHSANDLGVLMVDLFAYMGDVILYYQDRIANENFLNTSVERRSVMHHLRLIGYELRPPVSANTDLQLTFTVPGSGSTIITIPSGAEFRSTVPSDSPQTFTYLGPDLQIDLASDQVSPISASQVSFHITVWHSRKVATQVIGSSTGEPNQSFALPSGPLILDTLNVEVAEGAGWISWRRRESLLYQLSEQGEITLSSPQARDYYVQYDESGTASVIFGDGVYGRRPPNGTNNIRASYYVGGGVIGNVPAGAITQAVTSINQLSAVTNPQAAAGGEEAEATQHGVRFGPLAFRSGYRAVTRSDFTALAQNAGGVAKVQAISTAWNTVDLYIAPEGDTCRKVPEGLRQKLLAYFEDKRMAGTLIRILDPVCVLIDISLEVIADPHYVLATVRQGAINAISDLLAFNNVDFGQSLYQSDIYNALDPVPGVLAVNITRFNRQDTPVLSIAEQLQKYNLPSLQNLPEFIQRAVQAESIVETRVNLEPFEIPAKGELDIEVKVADR
jgi:hypothetical protein